MSGRNRGGLLSAAAGLASRGLHVFPVAGKQPVTRHGLHDATTDPAIVERLFRDGRATGVGVACGPSGLLVVDLDGEDGLAAWADLSARHRGHDRTLTATTGGGGLHVWFSGEGRWTVGRLGVGVERRGRSRGN